MRLNSEECLHGTPPGSETRETKILPPVEGSAHGVLFRPVRSPLLRLAVAAVLLLGVITYSVFELDYTVWRIQSQLLGPRYSKAIQRVTEAVLTKLRL